VDDDSVLRPYARRVTALRWDRLFADLEAQAQGAEQAERAAEVETLTRDEVGRLSVYDRLRAAAGAPLQLTFLGGHAVRGTVLRVGVDWLLLDAGAGREVIGASAQLRGVRGLGRVSAVPNSAGAVESRLGLRHVLRGVARDRSAVRVHLAGGNGGDPGSDVPWTSVDATIDRVGADFVEVATHSAAEVRRRGDVREVELIPLTAVVAVSRSA
jgi:hypothetical protein